MRGRDGGHEVAVEALVHDAEEAEARVRDARLVRRLGRAAARFRCAEMRRVHGRREQVGALVAVLLGAVQARAAGEDEVGAVEQLLLAAEKLGRRVVERRELVHAVVDHDAGVERAEQRQCERCVEPHVARADLAREGVDERADRGDLRLREAGLVEPGVRPDDRHAGRGRLPLRDVVVRARDGRVEHRLLDKVDGAVRGNPGEDVLRALVHEVPPEVGKDDEGTHQEGGFWKPRGPSSRLENATRPRRSQILRVALRAASGSPARRAARRASGPLRCATRARRPRGRGARTTRPAS